MKALTWNIDFKTSTKIYDFIFDKIDPDIALLQEVSNLSEQRKSKDYYIFHQLIGGRRNWGSAILIKRSLHFKCEEYALSSDPGWVIGGKVSTIYNRPLYLISIHARLKDLSTEKPNNYVIPYLRDRVFKELLPIIKSGNDFIIGGDFNADRIYDKYHFQPPGTEHEPFFDWLENDLGLINAIKEFYKKGVQTIFTRNTKHPYQNDYIFISPSLKKKLKICYTLDRMEIADFSDHSPVVVELE